MPVEETQDELVEALRAIDTATLQAIARELGIGERTLFRYRTGAYRIPSAKRLPLERALGLLRPSRRDAD